MYRYILTTLEHAIQGSGRNKVTTLSKFLNEEMTFSPCKWQSFSLRDFSWMFYLAGTVCTLSFPCLGMTRGLDC